jgi:hypothetical protein
VPLPNKKGALTHALNQALVCLARNAFGTPSFGRASNAVLLVKLPVSIQTAAEAADCFVLDFLHSLRTSQLTV